MTGTFPYGNDLAAPDTWVGNLDTKSRTWLVAYDGSFSIICGYHSFIFLGLESMNICVANLLNCGPSVGLPIGKLLGSLGSSQRAATRVENFHEQASNAKMTYDAAKMEYEQGQIGAGMQLYQRMTRAIPQYMRAHEPFSIDDLAGMPGAIVGAEIEAIASGALYYIEGYTGIIGDKIFGPQHVANTGDGLVSAGLGGGVGVWSVEHTHNLYWEIGLAAQARCRVANQSPSYDQPYRALPSLHPYLGSLPPAGCSLAETGFNPAQVVR